ncbi:hypothetical protein [Methanoregula sp.]|uniref:hypothetical protein n=1 Tax=Methanoregula sp. TaxID=2052170 RepID=UPI00236C4C8D|nr:hypothetical protein [Methanoregula sp.]MDD1687117.1 hypothetical protein [Methanoregula sp.]
MNPDEDIISDWITFGFCINNYLKNPDTIPQESREKVGYIVQSLDGIIAKSVLSEHQFQTISDLQSDENPQLFRAVWGPYAKEIKDKLAKGFSSIDPNPGFESWTVDIQIALKKFTNTESQHNIIFITDCLVNEKALFIDGEAHEILFPRHTAWRIISHRIYEEDSRTITFIYVKKRTIFSSG